MKLGKIVLAAVIATLSLSTANAQEIEYAFKGHPYLELQGGAQYTVGETAFGKLISPNAQFAIGYQFLPWFGARIDVGGWQSKGNWIYPLEVYNWNYVAPGIDLMFNLTSAIGGWKYRRVVDVNVFIGAAANIGFNNKGANALFDKGYPLEYNWKGTQVLPVGRAGLQLAFNVAPAVAITLEANANILSDRYNSKNAANPDWYYNALVGLRFNLGKPYKKIEKPAPAPVAPAPAPAPKAEPKPEPKPEPAPVVVKADPMTQNIFFKINSSVISPEEKVKADALAEYLRAYPTATVDILGLADKKTGNDIINDRLSAARAQAVTDYLVKEQGIDASRIFYHSNGSRVQPFEINEQNRVAICVAEEK